MLYLTMKRITMTETDILDAKINSNTKVVL